MTPEPVAISQAAAGAPDASPDPLAERVVDSRSIHAGRYLQLVIETIERADGTRHEREVVVHPGAVAIVAIDDDGRVLLVRQWRLPAGRAMLEIPAGTLDRQPDGSTEDPALAAPRELEEETGQRAAHWELVGSFWTAPGFATELMHLYRATGLAPASGDRRGPDDDEALELVRVPLAEAVAMAERGEFQDAKTLLALLWVARRAHGGG